MLHNKGFGIVLDGMVNIQSCPEGCSGIAGGALDEHVIDVCVIEDLAVGQRVECAAAGQSQLSDTRLLGQ